MGRPVKPPRAWFDKSRGEWCVMYRDVRVVRTGLALEDKDKAELAAAEYLIGLNKKAPPPTDRDVADVSCAEVLLRYLDRRTSEDPAVRIKDVARPEELRQRIRKLNAFWGPRAVKDVNEATCEQFTAFVESASYSRRCLGDFQAALNEAKRGALFRTSVQVSMPSAPEPREDSLSVEEAVALVLVCWRHHDTQQRRVGGHFVKGEDGKKKLVGGTLTTITGKKRPWWHVGKFIITAIATCSRSSRIFEASYKPEPGRPWMDVANRVLYRKPPGAKRKKSNKRAPSVDVAERLVAAMRRWSSDRVVDGRQVPGDRYVVQWQGQAADPKGAFTEAVIEARRLYPTLFLREDGTTPKQVIRHTLRHTGVTWLAETPGVNVEDICSYAGMTRAMFDRVYGHAHKARSKNIVAAQAKKTGKGKKVRWLIVPKARKAEDEAEVDFAEDDDEDE